MWESLRVILGMAIVIVAAFDLIDGKISAGDYLIILMLFVVLMQIGEKIK